MRLPADSPATRTTDVDGAVTYRFFVDPVIVIAVGEVASDAPALSVAVAIRTNYEQTLKYRVEISPQPDLEDGVDKAAVRFRWSLDGEEQASRVLVVRQAGRTVAINATVPAARVEELEPRIAEILDSVRLDNHASR